MHSSIVQGLYLEKNAQVSAKTAQGRRRWKRRQPGAFRKDPTELIPED